MLFFLIFPSFSSFPSFFRKLTNFPPFLKKFVSVFPRRFYLTPKLSHIYFCPSTGWAPRYLLPLPPPTPLSPPRPLLLLGSSHKTLLATGRHRTAKNCGRGSPTPSTPTTTTADRVPGLTSTCESVNPKSQPNSKNCRYAINETGVAELQSISIQFPEIGFGWILVDVFASFINNCILFNVFIYQVFLTRQICRHGCRSEKTSNAILSHSWGMYNSFPATYGDTRKTECGAPQVIIFISMGRSEKNWRILQI